MEEIKRLRAEIDVIDEEILKLLNKRAKLAKSIGEIKKQLNLEIHSPEREREVIDRLVKLNKELYGEEFPSEAVKHVFREIMSACLSLEKELRVAYIGPKATFTHQASLDTLDFLPIIYPFPP
jgi:prephenate dehydratase (EC 4.2.1.51)